MIEKMSNLEKCKKFYYQQILEDTTCLKTFFKHNSAKFFGFLGEIFQGVEVYGTLF